VTARELAIIRSVVYAGLFDYPLTLDEVHRTLVGCDAGTADILATYNRSALLRELVEHRDGFFFPAGRGDLVAERRRREARSRAFLHRHRRLLATICRLPFVRMIALSGSIAHLNLEDGGDLDLFIVTRGHRVWTVTLTILVLTRFLGCRREVCANFVVSDSALAFDQPDLFTANQIIHLKPLAGGDVMADLLEANPFVARYYPNAAAEIRAENSEQKTRNADRGMSAFRSMFSALSSQFIETASRRLYSWHLRRRASGWRSPEQVRLGADCLKLHTRSHRRSITERFDAAVSQALERAQPAVAIGGRRSRF
jgi:hypothetical protein